MQAVHVHVELREMLVSTTTISVQFWSYSRAFLLSRTVVPAVRSPIVSYQGTIRHFLQAHQSTYSDSLLYVETIVMGVN